MVARHVVPRSGLRRLGRLTKSAVTVPTPLAPRRLRALGVAVNRSLLSRKSAHDSDAYSGLIWVDARATPRRALRSSRPTYVETLPLPSRRSPRPLFQRPDRRFAMDRSLLNQESLNATLTRGIVARDCRQPLRGSERFERRFAARAVKDRDQVPFAVPHLRTRAARRRPKKRR